MPFPRDKTGHVIGDIAYATASGHLDGITAVRLVGENTAVGKNTTEDMIPQGGNWAYPTTAGFLNIASSSANDNNTGPGARRIRIVGLDANYNIQTETLTLDGMVGVDSNNQYLAVNHAEVIEAGSIGTNEGNIDIRFAGTTITDRIPAGKGQSFSMVYTVPAGHAFLISNFSMVRNAQTNVTSGMFASAQFKINIITEQGVHLQYGMVTANQNEQSAFIYNPHPFARVEEKMRFVISVRSQNAQVDVSGNVSGYLVDLSKISAL